MLPVHCEVMYDTKEEQPEMYLGSGTEYLIEVEQEIYNQFKERLVFSWVTSGRLRVIPGSFNGA